MLIPYDQTQMTPHALLFTYEYLKARDFKLPGTKYVYKHSPCFIFWTWQGPEDSLYVCLWGACAFLLDMEVPEKGKDSGPSLEWSSQLRSSSLRTTSRYHGIPVWS